MLSNRICPLQSDSGSGTYVGNGFEMGLVQHSGIKDWDVWDASLGGRAGGKKVLVVFTDGTNYTTVSTRCGIIHAGPTEDRFATTTARYVKIIMTDGYRPTNRNFSFWSFKILNQS